MPKPNIEDIFKKYGAKIEGRIKTGDVVKSDYSREYIKFKEELAPELVGYERLCMSFGNIIKVKVSQKEEEKIRRYLEISHLDIEPWQALTLSIIAFLGLFLFGLIISVAVMLIKGLAGFPFLFFFLIIVSSVFLFYYLNGYPARLANKWRLKASSQMVPAILYVVVYMRHTSNLERAISFASEHLELPLALDFRKIFYDVEIGKFSTIKESLDNYLETWRDYSPEFIESFHLIESSLFEPDEAGRIKTLEKALQVILDGVHDRMLKFTYSVRSPITNVYMLGVVLPTLGLALLPLISAMLGGMINWIHVFLLFNVIIPFLVFYLTDKVLMLRPGGYGETSLLEKNPLHYKYESKEYYFKAFLICLPFFILGLLPLIFQYTPLPEILGFQKDYAFSQLGMSLFGEEKIFGFISVGNKAVGPFGIGALILSMFIPLGLALFFYIVYKNKTEELIVEREKTKQLENEFTNSLFQLGNRIGNGTPPEIAFGKVAESSKGLVTEDFFRRVNYNIMQLGMDVERAIFDKKVGAIILYPSELIATSMRILIESSKKGLQVAASSLMSISEYMKNIQKINNRLRDMLAEIISDMKSNMTFLAPLLSGVVVGLAAMITSILGKLNLNLLGLEGVEAVGIGNLGDILKVFNLEKMIPPYFLQIAIGIYIIEIIFILTSTLVTINSGEDKLEKTHLIGKNLQKGISLYFVVGFLATLTLFVLTSVVLGKLF